MNKSASSLITLLLAMPLTAGAQAFQGLSTTSDGSALYFSSPVREVGSNRTFHSKIYRWSSAGGVSVLAEVADEGGYDGCSASTFFQLQRPQVSADGSVLAYTGHIPFLGGRFCVQGELNQGVVVLPGKQLTLTGSVAISPNGRYAITTVGDSATNAYHQVTDLASGVTAVVAGAFNGAAQRVTNEGTILTPAATAVILTDRTGGTRVVRTQKAVGDCLIDPAGKTLVYSTLFTQNNAGAITAINLSTGVETTLYTGLGPHAVSITADGSTVLFNDAATNGLQLFLVGTSGGTARQISRDPAGIATAVMSGDGRTVFAVTASSRLIRIDTTSGDATELISEAPLVTDSYQLYTPTDGIAPVGSVIDLYGSGIESVQNLSFCGRTLAVTPPHARFQVPWDLPAGACQVLVSARSGYEDGIPLTVAIYNPQAVQGGSVYHQNFQGIVSSASPARAGEAISFYLTGLGPLDSGGMVAPGFRCTMGGAPSDILFAGAAPGFAGFYQVNVRVPSLAAGQAGLACGFASSGQAFVDAWVGNGTE